MENVRAKAYKEVYEILKKVPDEDLKKIPKEVMIMLQTKMDKGYEYNLLEGIDFDKQDMLRETKVLLAIIYRDFWATEYERERINKKLNYDVQLYEEEQRKNYNPNEVFKDIESKNKIKNENVDLPVVVQKRNFFMRLINYIKGKFFNKKFEKDEER